MACLAGSRDSRGRDSIASREDGHGGGDGAKGPWVGSDSDVITVRTAHDGSSGARYGTLVHASLAAVPLDADPGILAGIVRTQARIGAATDPEVRSAIDAITQILAHPLLDAARLADRQRRCFREVPVTLL